MKLYALIAIRALCSRRVWQRVIKFVNAININSDPGKAISPVCVCVRECGQ